MPRLTTYILLLIAIGVTAAAGVLHGRISHRWGPRQDVSAAAQRLTGFPATFGRWQSRESHELAKPVLAALQCAGYLNRSYVNQDTGETVNVALLLGPAGPIAVHTPEVCFSSRDFKQRGDRRLATVRGADETENEFWTVTFDSTGLEKTILRVFYAWTTDGRWDAVESPRFTYAGKPYLYKIQLATTLPPGADLEKNDPCQTFLQDFIPALNRKVFQD